MPMVILLGILQVTSVTHATAFTFRSCSVVAYVNQVFITVRLTTWTDYWREGDGKPWESVTYLGFLRVSTRNHAKCMPITQNQRYPGSFPWRNRRRNRSRAPWRDLTTLLRSSTTKFKGLADEIRWRNFGTILTKFVDEISGPKTL